MAQETIKIGSNQIVTVTDENVGAVLLDIKAMTAADAVADIADLNKISVEVAVYRAGKSQPEYFCNDYLDYVLRGLYAGTFRYTVATTKRSEGYLIPLAFDGKLALGKGDRLEIKCKVQKEAFTDIDTDKSEVTIETVPTTNANQVLTVVESSNFITGDDNVNKILGDGIVKIVLVTDLTADYETSTKAKPVNGIVMTGANFEKIASENLLRAENLDLLQNNPETNIMNLVFYNSREAIHQVRLKSKFDKPVDNAARIMLLKKKYL